MALRPKCSYKPFEGLTDLGRLMRYIQRHPTVPKGFDALTCAFAAYDTCPPKKRDTVLDWYHLLQDEVEIRVAKRPDARIYTKTPKTHRTAPPKDNQYRKLRPSIEAPKELHSGAYKLLAIELKDYSTNELQLLQANLRHNESPNAELTRSFIDKLFRDRAALAPSQHSQFASTSP